MFLATPSAQRARRLVATLGCGALLIACGSGTDDDESVLVLAAASLTDVFGELEVAYQEAHPEIDIVMSFAASSAVSVQVEQGAPADVVALADTRIMGSLADGGFVEPAEVFADNRLTIAVPAGNPADVTGLGDFTRGELTLGLCAAQVPCGSYADEMFAAFGLAPDVDTRESDVRSLAAKVADGELDAAVVYATDVLAFDGGLVSVPIDVDAAPGNTAEVIAQYPIAVVTDSTRTEQAERFISFVGSDAGRAILSDAGFETP